MRAEPPAHAIVGVARAEHAEAFLVSFGITLVAALASALRPSQSTRELHAEYDDRQGWVNGRIEPYHHLSLDPAAAVLHYGQEILEGLKAFRGIDGRVRLFRPRRHAERLG